MTRREYFIHAYTYAAPIVSDEISTYAKGDSPQSALEGWLAGRGDTIYAAAVYDTADAYHRRKGELYRWLSPKALGQTASAR